MNYPLFISCPRNMEYLLQDELINLDFNVSRISPMGVYGNANLATIYQICLWSRIANRVQLILFKDNVADAQQLYKLCTNYNWQAVFPSHKTIAIDFHGQSHFINNTMYGAQLIKDAIVDYFRNNDQQRPYVDKDNPNIRLHAHLKHNILTVSLDLVGYSLHQRGYRAQAGTAPIKENIAAAILIRAHWPELAEQGFNLVDPLCGSGTFLIEAALMASNTAPGLLRDDQSLVHWTQHDVNLWDSVRQSALEKCKPFSNKIIGLDRDGNMIETAKKNIAAADFADVISVKQQAINDFQIIDGPGLLVANPPYGERLDDIATLVPVYKAIGKALYEKCKGWKAAILTANATLAQAIGLRADKQYSFYNGALPATLYCYAIKENNTMQERTEEKFSAAEQALFNRLTKNKKHLDKWIKRQSISSYRLYDAELPEYAFVIDIYNDWAHVQEYAPPKDIPIHKAEKRLIDLLHVLPHVLNIPTKHIVLKQRKQQKGKQQYQAFDNKNQQLIVKEGPAKFVVNLQDYLDTGLFLDHRLLRLQFSSKLSGKKFLNCFCYTATVSVHAALAGATTYNIDMSNTYLDWAERNFNLNKLPLAQHQFIRADCLQWLKQSKEKFDTIFLDPPSFSNSKRMTETLDIQRDHEMLIDAAMNLLNTDGQLYFSNNFKKFKLAESLRERYAIKDITRQTTDIDYQHSRNAHHCYLIAARKSVVELHTNG